MGTHAHTVIPKYYIFFKHLSEIWFVSHALIATQRWGDKREKDGICRKL